MGSAKRSYRGVSAAERNAQRRTALIDAALDLLAESGASAVTKKAVCNRARLNDRYFYENFTGRDDLLRAVGQHVTALGLQAVHAATLEAAPDVQSRVHAASDAAMDFMTTDPRRGRMLVVSQSDDVLQQVRLASTRAIAGAVAAMTRELLADAAPSDLDTDLAAFTLVSGTLELVAAWLRGEVPTTRDHLANLVASMLLATAEVSTTLPYGARQ